MNTTTRINNLKERIKNTKLDIAECEEAGDQFSSLAKLEETVETLKVKLCFVIATDKDTTLSKQQLETFLEVLRKRDAIDSTRTVGDAQVCYIDLHMRGECYSGDLIASHHGDTVTIRFFSH
jgi:hypothetical protein